jgi:hypothetical protein
VRLIPADVLPLDFGVFRAMRAITFENELTTSNHVPTTPSPQTIYGVIGRQRRFKGDTSVKNPSNPENKKGSYFL